jgi:predicted Rossmann-fold nucleotide-binding protein
MCIQPIEQCADLCGRQTDAVIGCAVIDAERIVVSGVNHMTTREHHVANIADAFVIFFGGKDPLVTAN